MERIGIYGGTFNPPHIGHIQAAKQAVKALGLSKKLPELSEDEQIALLAADGMLVKRPLAVLPDRVLVGFKEDEWAEKLAR